jgi:pimeloyl-ACP methyl ester carboxylesterase
MLSPQTIQLTEYRVQYYEIGEGSPIIFLHGFLGNGKNWEPIISHLQGHYCCIALDLLGFGGSSRPELKYNIWHQVRFVTEFLQAMDIHTFSLAGHSFGGWTAAAIGIELSDSDALKKIALLAPAGIRDDEFTGRYKHLRPLLWKTPWVDMGLMALTPIAQVTGHKETLDFAKKTRKNFREQPVAASFLRDRLKPEDAIDTVEKDLHRISVPTHIFAGQNDTTIPLWHCQSYESGIKQSKLYIYEDAGHDLNQTHASQIAEQIMANF